MSLPGQVRVRISSEAAGPITLTPVISREIRIDDLLEILLGAVGRDSARIDELLARGAVVQGASRFRWESIHAGIPAVEAALLRFPGPEPDRAFAAERCFHARLKGARGTIDLPRELADRRKLFRRRSFWSALMQIAAKAPPEYTGYSYRARADEYRITLPPNGIYQITDQARMLKYSGLADQVRRLEIESLELSVRR